MIIVGGSLSHVAACGARVVGSWESLTPTTLTPSSPSLSRMHLLDNYTSAEDISSGLNGDLEVVLEAYNQCKRRQVSLQTFLMRILDKTEREAESNLSAARERLEYVRSLRRGINGGQSNLEESHAARSYRPNRMEATTWRWFREHSDENGLAGPDSILSDISSRRPHHEAVEVNVSQDTIRERPFDYLAMKDEPSDGCITFSNSDQTSFGNENLDASVELTASLGSLASSLRSNVEQPFIAPVPLGLGMEYHLSPLVTVKRESLATLLNAFDHILLNGAL